MLPKIRFKKPKAHLSGRLLLALALLAAFAPFATDLYLPTFPELMRNLSATATQVQLSLMAFLLGLAAGQLVFGPLSDHWGRRPPLVVGTLVCLAASAWAALAPDIEHLVVARLLQGLSASAGAVIGRAIITDLARNRKEAAGAFNLMMTVLGVAPIVAPWVGSLLAGPVGWRGILWTVFAIVLVALVAVIAIVPESHPHHREAASGKKAKPPLLSRELLGRQFLGNTFAFAFAFGASMAYIAASPFLFQVMVGLDVTRYGLLFGAIALLIAVMAGLSARLAHAHHIHPRSLLRGGLSGLAIGAILLTAVVFSGLPPVWTIPPLLLAEGSLGFVLGNATSEALAAVPRASGSGSALLGALQFGLAALAAPLVSLQGEHSAVPLALTMLVSSLLALAAFAWAGPAPEHS